MPVASRWLQAVRSIGWGVSNHGPTRQQLVGPIMISLDHLAPGTSGIIEAISGPAALQQRLMEFGVLEGETVKVLLKAPLGDPIEIQIGGTRLSLRKSEAAEIRLKVPS